MQKTITIHVVSNNCFFCGNNPLGVDNVFLNKREADDFCAELTRRARSYGMRESFAIETRRVSFSSNPVIGYVSSRGSFDDTNVNIRAVDIREDQKCADVCFRPKFYP